ncbi:hypothetical protein ACT4UT_12235, partial [Bacillus sp. B-TM1]
PPIIVTVAIIRNMFFFIALSPLSPFKKSIIVKITTKGEPIRSRFQLLCRIVRKSLLFPVFM